MAIDDLVTGANLADEFDIGNIAAGEIRLKIDGTSIVRAVDGTLSAPAGAPTKIETLTLERSYLAAADVDIQDVNDNGAINVTNNRLDTGWAQAGQALEYTGTPDRVRLSVSVAQRIADNANIQRAAPQVQLRRNGVEIARSSTGYIRDFSDHEDSSNSITFVDPAPGTDPSYDLVSVQETTNGGVVTVTVGSFSAEAVELEDIDVLTPDTAGGGGVPPGGPTPGTPAGGSIAFDNCQDGASNTQFNLQVRNTTNAAFDWQAVWRDRPYATIPGLVAGNYTHTVVDNGNGTYDHWFEGTTPLGAFQNISINGSQPAPVGDNDCGQVDGFIS